MVNRFDFAYMLAAPVVLPFLAYRRIAKGKYRQSAPVMLGRRLPTGEERERFRNGSLWIHAVSVGEAVAAHSIGPFLREMLPDLPLLVTTVTETGQERARRSFGAEAQVTYFPVDLSWNVEHFLDCYNPKVFVVMETEIWPNFLSMAAERGTRIFMVNGKLSRSSARGYGSARRLLRPAFDAIRAFCMQNEEAAERMRHLCGRADDVHVTGNVKFDAPGESLSEAERASLTARFRFGDLQRPTLVVGSTHPGEEEIMLRAYEELRTRHANLRLILSPRHPERFDSVAEMCRRHAAGRWSVSRASAPDISDPDLLVLDTMGDLARVYGLGDIAVVAGSFTDKVGGHPQIEAAVHALPVVVGPYMHSQKEVDRLFQGDESGCLRSDSDGLSAILRSLLDDAEKRSRVGEQARQTTLRNRGSAEASAAVIRKYLSGRD